MSRTIQPPTMHTKLVAASVSDMVQEWYQGKCEVPPMQADTFERRISRFQSDLSQAAVAAALEAAAGEAQMHADHWRKAWETAKSNSSPKEARDWQTMMLGGLFVKDSIRALITPAQHDALAAHVAAEVAKARAEIYAQIEAMPRREELLGGQRTEYIQLHEALAWIGAKP